nr:retrovirus-related Pol polyprotein from transposon TNT 1-94 [Tanacetum cinerariifolium]
SPKDTRRTGAVEPQRRNALVENSTSNALVSQCDGIGSYDWSYQAKEEPANFALMAITSSSSSSDNEVQSCSKACSKAYDQLHTQYDKLTVEFCKSQIDVLSYQAGLESVEARLVVYKQNESILEENINMLKNEVQARDNVLVTLKQKLNQAEKERDDLKLKFDKFQTSSKNLTELLQPSGGYNDVPPLITGNFMPPKPDLVFPTASIVVETDHSAFTVQLSPTKPSQDLSHTTRPMAPIIEDWPVDAPILAAKPKPTRPKTNSSSKRKNRKTCFVCRSVDHLIKDCNFHSKPKPQPTPRNYAHRGFNKQNASFPKKHPQKHMVPAAVLTKSKPASVTAVRPGNPQYALKDKGVIESGYSRHMIGNMSYLSDFQELNGGYLAFGGNPKGGKISGKGKIKIDSLLPIPFWAEAVNTACYVQNRVLVTKPHNKTPYELLHGRTPSIGFMRPFGCLVTILNTLDPLGKFEGKVNEGFLVGYSVNSKAFRVFNSRTWEEANQQYMLFPVWFTGSLNPHNKEGDAAFDEKEHDAEKPEFAVNLSPSSSALSGEQDDMTKKKDKEKSHVEYFTRNKDLNAVLKITLRTAVMIAAGPSNTNTSPTHGKLSLKAASQLFDNFDMLEMEDIAYSDHENVGAEADFNNLETSITVSPIPTIRTHKAHAISQIIGYRNKKDERGIVVNNKARLVAQGHTQEERINYEEVFAPLSRIEAIILFLAYASFMGCMVYQMDVKSAFLYGTIEEEVYVCQPLGFEDPDHPDKVYKVVKALYGQIDQTLFIKKQKGDILLVQIYVDDIIFGATNKDLCKSFEKLMKDKFQMSSIGELTFFLGLRVNDWFVNVLNFINTRHHVCMAYSDSDYAGASLDRNLQLEDVNSLDADSFLGNARSKLLLPLHPQRLNM